MRQTEALVTDTAQNDAAAAAAAAGAPGNGNSHAAAAAATASGQRLLPFKRRAIAGVADRCPASKRQRQGPKRSKRQRVHSNQGAALAVSPQGRIEQLTKGLLNPQSAPQAIEALRSIVKQSDAHRSALAASSQTIKGLLECSRNHNLEPKAVLTLLALVEGNSEGVAAVVAADGIQRMLQLARDSTNVDVRRWIAEVLLHLVSQNGVNACTAAAVPDCAAILCSLLES